MLPSHYVRIPAKKNGLFVLPVRIWSGDPNRFIDIDAHVLPEGLESHITVDIVGELLPEVRDKPAEFFETRDFTFWSPYFDIQLRRVSDHFVKTTRTCSRLAPVSGARSVGISDPILRSMADRSEDYEHDELLLSNPLWPYRSSLETLQEEAVVVLGCDSTEESLRRLKVIQCEANYERKSIIVRDLLDFRFQALEQKVAMLVSCCSMVILENTFPSGHIDELGLCKSLRAVTAVLRQEGKGATWMQSDYSVDHPNIREFVYSLDPASTGLPPLHEAVHMALRWGRKRLLTRREDFDERYPWRTKQRMLEESVWPSWLTMVAIENMKHLADDIVRAAGRETYAQAPTFEDDGRLLLRIENGADVLAEMTGDVLALATDVLVRFSVVILNAAKHAHSVVVASPSDFGLKPDDFEYGDVSRMFEEVEDQPIEITPAVCASWF